ncbi:MAG: ParA family protein [Fibrobacteres bacterium]|nr:ParA family protein [Fibrobacterota bacterium]
MTRSFAFLSKKGGVGKTTFCLNCAHALAFSGFRTLLVDMDGQANLTRHLLRGSPGPGLPDISKALLRRSPPDESILTTGYENLELLAGSASLDDLPILDPRLLREPTRLKMILEELSGDYDFILADCPPSVNWLTRMGLFAVQGVIVPIQAEPYALQGLQDLIPMLDKMTATAQLHKIVVNMYRANTQLHQSILREIAEAFPGRIAKQAVRQTIHLAEAARAGLSIFEYAPASSGALDLYALCFELFDLSPEKVKERVLARTAPVTGHVGDVSGSAGDGVPQREPSEGVTTFPESGNSDRA